MKPIPVAVSTSAVLSAFLFPWPMTVILALVAAFFVPPIIFIVGCLLDMLYYAGEGFPYFSVSGFIVTLLAYGVQSFVKTRII